MERLNEPEKYEEKYEEKYKEKLKSPCGIKNFSTTKNLYKKEILEDNGILSDKYCYVTENKKVFSDNTEESSFLEDFIIVSRFQKNEPLKVIDKNQTQYKIDEEDLWVKPLVMEKFPITRLGSFSEQFEYFDFFEKLNSKTQIVDEKKSVDEKKISYFKFSLVRNFFNNLLKMFKE